MSVPLPKKSSCTVRLTADTPKTLGKFNNTFTIEDSKGKNIRSPMFDVTVEKASKMGHFVWNNEAGQEITALNISQGDAGTITLKNSGTVTIHGGAVGGKILTIPKNLQTDFIGGSCLTTNALTSNESCTLRYDIPKNYAEIDANIFAAGVPADNNPNELPVTISKLGHFEFVNSKGQSIGTSLNLKVGDQATISLKNSGGTIITAVKPDSIVTLSPVLTKNGDFNTSGANGCGALKTLAPNQSCNISYQIVTPNLNGALTAAGNRADNNPSKVNVTTSSLGHFEWEDETGKQISSLDLNPDNTGTITLKNTGDITIIGKGSNPELSKDPEFIIDAADPESEARDFTSGNCFSTKKLAPGETCTLGYKILEPKDDKQKAISLIAEGGTSVDNNKEKLTLNVTPAPKGHFQFYDANHKPLSGEVDINDGDTGKIILENTGNGTITNTDDSILILDKSLTDNGDFTNEGEGSCKGIKTLKHGGSCSVKYHIQHYEIYGNITATGANADKSPEQIKIKIK